MKNKTGTNMENFAILILSLTIAFCLCLMVDFAELTSAVSKLFGENTLFRVSGWLMVSGILYFALNFMGEME